MTSLFDAATLRDARKGSGLALNPGQIQALTEILVANAPGQMHLLTGYAGSGKTTLLQYLAEDLVKRGFSLALTAPTHKAVGVLRARFEQSPLVSRITFATVHSMLSLRGHKRGDQIHFTRPKKLGPVTFDVVVIDECSMLDRELMGHIRRYLSRAFVLFVGDPAQVPPINEVASEAFQTMSRSHLHEIVRQAAGNPILEVAHAVRDNQAEAALPAMTGSREPVTLDWSWIKPRHARDTPQGVFVPREADRWLREAFTSAAFKADPDAFRYLCWTNARVAQINGRVRRWIYGAEIDAPFVVGERALVRAPLLSEDIMLLATNDEVDVLEISEDVRVIDVGRTKADTPGWRIELPTWRVLLRRDAACQHETHLPRDRMVFNQVLARLRSEAQLDNERWADFHQVNSSLVNLQAIYAMTVHCAQGSTFGTVFVDIDDIRRRAAANPLEMLQMLYVAVTRPTTTLVLIGA